MDAGLLRRLGELWPCLDVMALSKHLERLQLQYGRELYCNGTLGWDLVCNILAGSCGFTRLGIFILFLCCRLVNCDTLSLRVV